MVQLKVFVWGINESRLKMENLCISLLETAKVFKINAEFIGIGYKFKEHKQRIEILEEFLKWEDPNTILLFMDGSDTLFNDMEEKIIQKFVDFDTEILISAERFYTYQYGQFKDKYDSIDSAYRYVNAGTFMGMAGSLKKMVEELILLSKQFPSANDQALLGIWAYQNFENKRKVRLDSECIMFWVTTGDWQLLGDTAQARNYILHPFKNQRPAIIHCPGIGFEPNNRSYTAAFKTVINSRKQPNKYIAIIAPLKSEKYNIDPVSKNKEDFRVPSWYYQRHPNIAVFFYGSTEDQQLEDVIPTNYVFEAIRWLEKRYHFDIIVHIPPNKFVEFDPLNNLLQNFNSESFMGDDFPIQESFFYSNEKFFPASILMELPMDTFSENWSFSMQLHIEARKKRIVALSENDLSYDAISLGGWWGPAIALNKLELRNIDYPFCMIDSTAKCVYDLIKGNIDQFFLKDKNTLKPNHNWEEKETNETYNKRIENFLTRLSDPKPILFIRAVISNDFKEEISIMTEMIEYLNQQQKRNDKLLLILYNQKIGTIKVKMHNYDVMIWAVHGNIGVSAPNSEFVHRNTERAIEYALDQKNWEYDAFQIKQHLILNHRTKEI